MINKLTTYFLIFLALFLVWPATSTLAFNLFGNSCTGKGADSAVCKDAANTGVNDPIAGDTGIVQTAANLVAVITGITAVVMIIISGLRLVTSGGETEKVSKAKSMLIGSVIGLVIVALAWVLISFIISRFVYS